MPFTAFAPISPDELRQRVAHATSRTREMAWLVQGKIDWLTTYLDRASDPTEAGLELERCHAWSQALAGDDMVQPMSPDDDEALLNAIATVDQATAQNVAIGQLIDAVDGLIQAYAAPA